MTKHMYRFFLDPANTVTLSEANQWLLDWSEANEAWVGDPEDSMLKETNTDAENLNGTTYWRADWRFHPILDKTELQSKLNQVLQNNLSWFVALYHVCEHDDRPIGNCSWDAIYYWPDLATIPDDIENLVPDPSSVDEVIQVNTI